MGSAPSFNYVCPFSSDRKFLRADTCQRSRQNAKARPWAYPKECGGCRGPRELSQPIAAEGLAPAPTISHERAGRIAAPPHARDMVSVQPADQTDQDPRHPGKRALVPNLPPISAAGGNGQRGVQGAGADAGGRSGVIGPLLGGVGEVRATRPAGPGDLAGDPAELRYEPTGAGLALLARYELTPEGLAALAQHRSYIALAPSDPICPHCQQEPRQRLKSGVLDGYCLTCARRIRAESQRARRRRLGIPERSKSGICPRCKEHQRHISPKTGKRMGYCLVCMREMFRERKAKALSGPAKNAGGKENDDGSL